VTRKEQTVRKLITLFAALMLIGCANGNNRSATIFALDSTAAFSLENSKPAPGAAESAPVGEINRVTTL